MTSLNADASTSNENNEEAIASILLSIGAVSLKPFSPFTWASGLLSPVYCDNRILMGYPEKRQVVIHGFASLIKQHGLQPDLIAGTATAGIPHAAWLAHDTNLPMVYVRSKEKSHGQMNRIEGPIRAGQSAIIIEDLISTGMSSIGVVRALVKEGVKVLAVLAIFSYGFEQAAEAFDSASVPIHTLTDFETLLKVAESEGFLAENEVEILRDWRSDPHRWSDENKRAQT